MDKQYTRGQWKAEAAGNEVILRAGDRFLAFFEADEDKPQEPEEVLGNAERAAACVNACEGLDNPVHALRTLRADSSYLSRYRDAYCANVSRQTDMELALRALSAEVLATRTVLTVHPFDPERDVKLPLRVHDGVEPGRTVQVREEALVKARKAVDDLDATNVKKFVEPGRADLSRYKGLDVRNVQLLLSAVEDLIESRREAPKLSPTAIVGLPEFARLVGVLTECCTAPPMEDAR